MTSPGRSRAWGEARQWPAWVIDACEQLERDHPRWSVSWSRDRGYIGRLDAPMRHRAEVSADDPSEMARLMVEIPAEHDYSTSGCAWCLARLWEQA